MAILGSRQGKRCTIGFLSTWSVYEGTTIDEYTYTLLQGIYAAAHAQNCNLLIGCGVSLPGNPRGSRKGEQPGLSNTALRDLTQVNTSAQHPARLIGAVGFSDSAHFTHIFQQENGVTPRAFRNGKRIK